MKHLMGYGLIDGTSCYRVMLQIDNKGANDMAVLWSPVVLNLNMTC